MATNKPRPLTDEIRAKGQVPVPPPPPPGSTDDLIRSLRNDIRRFKESADAGYELSRWAASINWDGTPNGNLWLRDLQRHIERVQELWPGPRGGMRVEPVQPSQEREGGLS